MQPRKMGVMDADLLRVMWCYHCCAFLLDSMAKHRRCWADVQGWAGDEIPAPGARWSPGMVWWWYEPLSMNFKFEVRDVWGLESATSLFRAIPVDLHWFHSHVASLCHWNCAIGTYHIYTRCIVLFIHIQYPQILQIPPEVQYLKVGCRDLNIWRAFHPMTSTLVQDAGVEPKDINEILLVGGMTRMPKVRPTALSRVVEKRKNSLLSYVVVVVVVVVVVFRTLTSIHDSLTSHMQCESYTAQ